jgi:hypothetical protein
MRSSHGKTRRWEKSWWRSNVGRSHCNKGFESNRNNPECYAVDVIMYEQMNLRSEI